MNKSFLLKKKIYLFFFLVFSFMLFLYLTYNLIYGTRGIISYNKSMYQFDIYKNEESTLIIKNSSLENSINRLKPETIDLDYLDEILRIKTGYILNDELLIVSENQ